MIRGAQAICFVSNETITWDEYVVAVKVEEMSD